MNRFLILSLFLDNVITCNAQNRKTDEIKRFKSDIKISSDGNNLHGKKVLINDIEAWIEQKKKELAQTDVNDFRYKWIQRD